MAYGEESWVALPHTHTGNSVQSTDPDATVILYGSFARGDQRNESDLDLIILLNKEKVDRADEKRVKYPLYDIEFDTGQILYRHIFTKFFINL